MLYSLRSGDGRDRRLDAWPDGGEPRLTTAGPTPLVAITPYERDAAAAAIRGMFATLLIRMVVDAIVAAINEHRDKTNCLT